MIGSYLNWIVRKAVFKVVSVTFLLSARIYVPFAAESGLLFHLSGDNGFVADTAAGNPEPVLVEGQELVSGGAVGGAIRCPDFSNVIAFSAPGNIYAARGTMAFFFRSRYPFGTVPFKLIQVSYGDHSSFDMQWMRIDYNGAGFDAFVTDINLARTRVSWNPAELPSPEDWVHIAVSWDETKGIRLYIDGRIAAEKDTMTVYDTGLGFFGTHGYYINPLYVGSGSADIRGGDFDELCIFDRMLDSEEVARLARGEKVEQEQPFRRSLDDPVYRDQWHLRYGWNRSNDPPPVLDAPATKIRKVEIHDAWDHKQWFWKGCDGIRETTWPGVYNRSRLPGRNDYFPSPDWNCYSLSGKSVTFDLPEEPWNHIEITGAAYGSMDYLILDRESSQTSEIGLFRRSPDQERTYHRLPDALSSGKLRFTNTEQETPIGELSIYHVEAGKAPTGIKELAYTVNHAVSSDYPCLEQLRTYINGRYMADERSTVVALPDGAPQNRRNVIPEASMPFVHILVPCDFRDMGASSRYSYTWENIDGGLDGVEIEIPAFDAEPTHGDVLPMNVSVRDPLWPDRTLLDFSFSIKPGEPKTLWLDTRDRILPNGYSLYMVIAAAGGGFDALSLDGMRIRLVFKDREEARKEHEIDRFTQVRDNCGNILESRPNSKILGLFDRFHRDITDLLRVNPDHYPGKLYWSHYNPEQGYPLFRQPEPPPGVPLWAFRQVTYLDLVSQVVLWWIDNRQIENGELGGGISDDSDFTHAWPIPALMGVEPDKITDSLHRLLDACYENGMFTDGLNTLMMDGLHTTEEGTNVQAQLLMLEYGDPKLVERIMETARAYERVTGINKAGHRHFRSSFFSATQTSEEGPWLWSMYQTFRLLHPGLSLVEFNGNPRAKNLLLEMADGLLSHRKKDGNGRYYTPGIVNFETDEDKPSGFGAANHLLWAAWCWTGDDKYLQPLFDSAPGFISGINAPVIDILGKRATWGKQLISSVTPQRGSDFSRHLAWQMTGDKQFLEEYYGDQVRYHSQEMYLMTEGHIWTDRVAINAEELQRSRLGGVARRKKSAIYPGQVVSWKFLPPSTWKDAAILIPYATDSEFTILAYNLSDAPVSAEMTGWMVAPGEWELEQGIDTDSDDEIDTGTEKRTVRFERTENIELMFRPHVQTIVHMKLKKKGTPYWNRPDLGIGRDDVKLDGNTLTVTVHSLGSVNTPASRIALEDASGKAIAYADIPPLEAPVDLFSRTVRVIIPIPSGANRRELSLHVNPEDDFEEITRMNNTLRLFSHK